jgi:AraC-like DNA-binding protein
MEYEKFFPEGDNERALVECYYRWRGDGSPALELQSPPTGFGAIVVNALDPYVAWQAEDDKQIVPAAFACGLFTSNYHLQLSGPFDVTGVVLKPSALHAMFGLRMSTLVNTRIPLSMLDVQAAAVLPNLVNEQKDTRGRVSMLRSFIAERGEQARTRFSILEDIIQWIDKSHGNATIDEVAAKFRVSRRYIETQFLEKVGVSPKFYARIRRFSYLSNVIVRTPELNWQDIVELGGFHDQSHLVKEFLKFNRMSPAQYMDNHKEIIRLLQTPALRNFTINKDPD